jgi:uncharacterized protein (DUF427 family)
MPEAIGNGAVLTESGQTVLLEGNHDFPPEVVDPAYLQPSDRHTRAACGRAWRATTTWW